MDLEERLDTHLDIEVSKHETHKTYFMFEEAKLMITKTKYIDEVMFDSKFDNTSEFGKALAHLSYKNIKFSRKICKLLLKTISYATNDQVEHQLSMVHSMAQIKDEFQVHRLEYLFGFGFPMHTKVDQVA